MGHYGQRIVRAAVLLLMLLLLLLVILQAVPRGAASVMGYIVQAHIDNWVEQQAAPTSEAWQRAQGVFDTAYGLTPDDPSLLQQGGRLYEWGGLNGDVAKREQALAYYRASLSKRPTWPYAWSDLAGAKSRFGQLDDEFQQAFSRALALGAWEPMVQMDIGRIGFANWKALSTRNRQLLVQNIRNAISIQPGKMIAMSREFNLLWTVCSLDDQHPAVRRACN